MLATHAGSSCLFFGTKEQNLALVRWIPELNVSQGRNQRINLIGDVIFEYSWVGWKHASCLGLVGKLNTNKSSNLSFQWGFLLRFCQLCPFDFLMALLHTADWWVFEAVMWRTPQRRHLMKQKATLSWLTTYCRWQLLSISVPNYLHVFSLVCPHLGCQATARCVYWLEHSQSIHPHMRPSIRHSSFFL